MAGKTSSQLSPANDNGEKIRIKKPLSNSAREIRNSILGEYFGYTENDIKELDVQMPGKFYICAVGSDGNREMTFEQVRGWLPDSDGMISITLNDYWLKNLRLFRERQVNNEIFRAVSSITDSELKGRVSGYLRTLFSQSESERTTALNDLLTETGGTFDSSAQILTAISYLTDKAGYQNNPLLILVKANAAFTEYRMRSGPGYDINTHRYWRKPSENQTVILFLVQTDRLFR